MSQSSPVHIEPFRRLQVSDGLLLTAERWRQAHDYHRQRQNVHYQSLNQSGIVAGLGVFLIPPPTDVAEEYRDGRWLQVQPGVAIDAFGNPIVVPQAIAFRIASPPPLTGTLTVYVLVRYVDPERLHGQADRELIQETFRLDETTTLPSPEDVELCRIQLSPGKPHLVPTIEVLSPAVNNLDLRFRRLVQPRSPKAVQVGHLASTPASILTNLAFLLQAAPVLYPAMQGTLRPISLSAPAPIDPDLLYLTRPQLLSLSETERDGLQRCLENGCVVLVEVSAEEANIAQLGTVREELKTAIASLSDEPSFEDVQRELTSELEAVQADLTRHLSETIQSVQAIAQQLGLAANPEPLSRLHPLRTQPFLFSQLPSVKESPIHLYQWGGLVLAIGSLSSIWGLDDTLSVPRETLRTAQEFGINLLHFAWQRHQLTQLQKPEE